MSLPLLVECGDHSYSPYSFICQHLLDNPSLEWNPMEVGDGREVEYDWICPDCLDRHLQGENLGETLQTVCIGCVRRIRGEE